MCVRNKKTYALNVNGFEVKAEYDSWEEENVLDPVIDLLASIRSKNFGNGKTVAFFSGPPGAGKSTFALSLCRRAQDRNIGFSFECLGLDGFHKTKSELARTLIEIDGKRICLIDRKGAPETFDAEAFSETLEKVKYRKSFMWPVYDRRIHDVADCQTKVMGEILLIEGNWLMLPGVWAEARKMCDASFSIDADDALLKERLIDRKMRGGKTRGEASEWFDRVDGPNISFYRQASAPADVNIVLKNGILVLSNKF